MEVSNSHMMNIYFTHILLQKDLQPEVLGQNRSCIWILCITVGSYLFTGCILPLVNGDLITEDPFPPFVMPGVSTLLQWTTQFTSVLLFAWLGSVLQYAILGVEGGWVY